MIRKIGRNPFPKLFIFILALFLPSNHLLADNSRLLLIKGDYDYPPFEYLNAENLPDGFNVELMRSVAEKMGLKIQIQLDAWNIVRAEIEQGKIDVLLGMYNTKERDKLVDFSVPHLIISYAVFVRKGSDISSLEQARRKVIIVQEGDLGHDYVIENKITDKLISKNTIESVLVALSSGEADCAFVSRLQGMIILEKNQIKNVMAVGSPIIQRKYCFAVTEGNSNLLAKLNEGLVILKTSGEYDKIYNKWFGIYEGMQWDYQRIFKYIILTVAPLMLVIIFAFSWTWSLKKQVAHKTKELRESREGLKITLDSIGDGVIATDINGKITRMNPIAEKLTGWKLEEVKERPLAEILHVINSQTFEKIENLLEKVLKHEKWTGIHNHATLISRQGKEYQIADNGAPIRNEKGEIVGAVLVFRDVTEQVRLEEMMIQNEKMLSVGGLAAGMAHEINNPLAGIMQTANVMAYRLGGEIDMPANLKAAEKAGTSMEAIREFMDLRGIPRMLEIIIESGRRVATIVDNMLNFTRKSDDSIDFHVITELIDKALELSKADYDLKKRYDFKLMEIKKEYGENIPSVPCEGAKIQQVLLNILRNGAQAMQEADTKNPSFIIRTKFEQEHKMVCIEIEDNGPGMDEVTRKRVFEPFFTTKAVGKGTGLGLSVSYFIITENHKGKMVVESQPGSGAKFCIYLPSKR